MKKSTRIALIAGAAAVVVAAALVVVLVQGWGKPAFLGVSWKATAWSYNPTLDNALPMSMTVSESGGATGYLAWTGLHEYTGEATLGEGDAIEFGPPRRIGQDIQASTADLAYEQGFINILATMTTWEVADGVLTLRGGFEGQDWMTFEPMDT
ncbi:MAG: META domain-containing protein [Propionibacteriaceae bacterium]|jgi:hypothetical protein|nr:META domain-containing protein [Propionibacteriaceae bacterium]